MKKWREDIQFGIGRHSTCFTRGEVDITIPYRKLEPALFGDGPGKLASHIFSFRIIADILSRAVGLECGMDMKEVVEVGAAVAPYVGGAASGLLGALTPAGKTMLGMANNELDMFLGLPQRQRMLERAAEAFKRAEVKAAASGLKLTPAGAKFLVPWFEGTAMEENKGIREMWANLLANRVLPNGERVRTAFIPILKQMSPDEAATLEWVGKHDPMKETDNIDPAPKTIAASEVGVVLDLLQAGGLLRFVMTIDRNQYDPTVALASHRGTCIRHEHGLYRITDLGLAFIQACQPPHAER